MAVTVLSEPCSKCGGVIVFCYTKLTSSEGDHYPNGKSVVEGLCQKCASELKVKHEAELR